VRADRRDRVEPLASPTRSLAPRCGAELRATLLEPDALPVEAIAALRSKYPQYASHRLEDQPSISITIERARSWGVLDQD
jgi:hypothetical protein